MLQKGPLNHLHIFDGCTDFDCWRIDLIEIKEGLANKVPNSASVERGFRHYYLPIYRHDDGRYVSVEDWTHKILTTLYEIVEVLENNVCTECDNSNVEIRPGYYRQSAYLVLYAYLLSLNYGNLSKTNQQFKSTMKLNSTVENITWPPEIENHIIPKLIKRYTVEKEHTD